MLRNLSYRSHRHVITLTTHQPIGQFKREHAGAEIARVERALDVHLGRRAPPPTHPLQRPSFLHIDELPAQAWFDAANFPFLRDIEAHTDAIRTELLAVLARETELTPYVDMPDNAPAAATWRALNRSPNWGAYHFFRHGEVVAAHAQACPRTFAALEAHLAAWMQEADARVHGTTHERPIERFRRAEQAALRPLPVHPVPPRQQRHRRRVAHDAFVDVETVRYSVPYQLVRDHVEVAVAEDQVRIFHGATLVATHPRVREPFAQVVDPAHRAGLWRPAATAPAPDTVPLLTLGRSLDAYAAVVEADR